jgi:hypothetical protein
VSELDLGAGIQRDGLIGADVAHEYIARQSRTRALVRALDPKTEKHLPRFIDGQGCFAKLGERQRDSTHARPTRSRAEQRRDRVPSSDELLQLTIALAA